MGTRKYARYATGCLVAGVAGIYTSGLAASASDFGTDGLIKIPNARMADDATLRATITNDELADIYNITFQALPRLQATFRYTIFNPDEIPGSRDGLRDRSYELKSQLWQESQWVPAVSLGIRDILGTGVWEGEYVVASKAWGELDLTLGMGWGRLGSRSGFDNPFRLFSDRFEERPSGSEIGGRFGGKDRGDSFFRGKAAVFGGLAYQLPKQRLTLLAEYESDRYDREVGLGTLQKPSALNLAVLWSPIRNVGLRLSWLRGETVGLTISAQVDAKRKQPKRVVKGAGAVPVDLKTGALVSDDSGAWYRRMVIQSEQAGLSLRSAKVDPDDPKATIEITNYSYNLTADALNQAMRLSERYMPDHITQVDILLEDDGWVGPSVSYALQRKLQYKAIIARGHYSAADKIRILAPREMSDATNSTNYKYPGLGFGFDLAAKTQLMDPDAPLRGQFYAKLSGRLQLSEHFNVWMRYEQNIYNDFSTDRPPDSPHLPNVRTLVNRYLVEGESGIEHLYAEYKKSVSNTVHTRTYAGLLESMYGGIGTEMLYVPHQQRWALGASVNAVKQRGFNRDFSFRQYKTLTGHVSAYYASPFYDIDVAVHVGRYLAEDRGYTFEARRTFDGGFSLGGFFTRTNVSSEAFGEGSFDKGLFFRIPFDGILPGNTRGAFSTILRPLERDGGRRLENFGGSLWFDRRFVRYDALDRNLDRMLPR